MSTLFTILKVIFAFFCIFSFLMEIIHVFKIIMGSYYKSSVIKKTTKTKE